MPQKKTVKIDMLVEGPSGELLFQTVEVTPDNVKELLRTSTNPVIKHNLKKELKEKGLKFETGK